MMKNAFLMSSPRQLASCLAICALLSASLSVKAVGWTAAGIAKLGRPER